MITNRRGVAPTATIDLVSSSSEENPASHPAPTLRRPSKVKLSAAATAEKRRRKRNAELRLEVARSELKKAYKVYKALN